MMEADEQRIAPRKPVVLKVRFRASTVEEFAERYSRDLSEGGMFVRSPGPLPQPGTVLLLECRLSDGALLINGAASVAWVRPQPTDEGPSGFGMRFDDLSPESRAVLAMILETSQAAGAPARQAAQEALLSAAPAAPARPASGIGVTRFPTLIGELPPLPPPPAPAPRSESPAGRPARPAWFHSHEFDDDDEAPPATTAPALAAPAAAPSAPSTGPDGPPKAVPSWFHSTALLEGTPAPTPEPRAEVATLPVEVASAAPAPSPSPSPPRPEAPAALSPPAPPRRTEPQPAVTDVDRPLRLPRPTPAVVAAPRDPTAEPSFPGRAKTGPRRHWIAAMVLGAAALVAFGVGYLFLEFVLPDRSAEVLRELERHQSRSAVTAPIEVPAPPEPAAAPPPAPTPEPAATPLPVPAPIPAPQPTPTVVIPRAPASTASPAPAARTSPKRRTIPKPPPAETTEPEEEPEPAPRKSKSSNSDFQKRLRELERMLKRR